MKKFRFLFFLWGLFWLFVWVFGDSNLGIYILAASIVCAGAEILWACHMKKNLSVRLAAGATAPKGGKLPLTVTVFNRGIPGGRVEICVNCRNLLTGEETRKTVHMAVLARGEWTAEVTLHPAHCGKLRVTAAQITVRDAFGLWAFRKNSGSRAAVLVLPDIYPVEISVGQQRQVDLSSEEYSMLHPGDDPSETFALREYRPGDKLKNIHWKLSEKTGQTTVRELGLLVNNSLLVLFDNSVPEQIPDGDRLAFLGEMAVSVSSALIGGQFAHNVGWLDRESDQVVLYHVAGEEDLTAVMSGILSAQTCQDSRSVPQRFFEDHTLSEFAHILVLTHSAGKTPEESQIVYLSPTIQDKEGLYVEI